MRRPVKVEKLVGNANALGQEKYTEWFDEEEKKA